MLQLLICILKVTTTISSKMLYPAFIYKLINWTDFNMNIILFLHAYK